MNTNLDLSIVVPVYNEAGNLQALAESILRACSILNFEMIFVNDGSTDSTRQELIDISKKIPQVKILTLRHNFGQTAALAAGIDCAQGKVVVPLDGDGQNDPQDIPRLLEKMREGYDVVSGWRKNRKDPYWSRRLPSNLANTLISRMTGVHLHDYGCSLKAYRRSIIQNLQIHGEMHRFLPAWCAWQGGKITEIPVNHFPRVRGKSKYGLFRIFKVLIDLITVKFFSGYLSKPNYLFSGSGLITLLISLLAAFVAMVDKFGPDKLPKFRIPLLLLSIFFGLVSVFMFFIGLLAELLVRLYFQVRNEKSYRLEDE